MAERSSSEKVKKPRAQVLEHADDTGLAIASRKHLLNEKASFHTPGHKGRLHLLSPELDLNAAQDLTEVDGLDDLSDPTGPLLCLQEQAARLYGARHTFISVNGATLAVVASIMAAGWQAKHDGVEDPSILVPRNAHRSVIDALCLSDLRPIWYEPEHNPAYNVWGSVDPGTLSRAFAALADENIVMVVLVSPTYGGAVSDIKTIAQTIDSVSSAKNRKITLLVDEAHGAHHLDKAAPALGAHLTAHSLHKTTSGLTQTGLLQIGSHCAISIDLLRAAVQRLSTTSPSYLLMASIEACVELLSKNGKHLVEEIGVHSARLRDYLEGENGYRLYVPDSATPTHFLVKHLRHSARGLRQHLSSRGVIAETLLGDGLLLLLGVGTNAQDIDILLAALEEIDALRPDNADLLVGDTAPPCRLEAVMTPYEASQRAFMRVPLDAALDKISADFIAPCPPGIPLIIPGQKITEEVLKTLDSHMQSRDSHSGQSSNGKSPSIDSEKLISVVV